MTIKCETSCLMPETSCFVFETSCRTMICSSVMMQTDQIDDETSYETSLRPFMNDQGISPQSHVSIDLYDMRLLETPYIYINSIEIRNRAYIGSYLYHYEILKNKGSQGSRGLTHHTWRMR